MKITLAGAYTRSATATLLALIMLASSLSISALVLQSVSQAVAQTPVPVSAAPITFGPNTLVVPWAGSGEPHVVVGADGTVFVNAPGGVGTERSFIWRSRDGGRTFEPVGLPITRLGDSAAFYRPVAGPGGGDTHMSIALDGTVYFSDLWLGSSSVAVSLDNGENWVVHNPFASQPVSDRQWVTAFKSGVAFQVARLLEMQVFFTLDFGATWNPGCIVPVKQVIFGEEVLFSGLEFAGPIIVDPRDGALFIPHTNLAGGALGARAVSMARSFDGGLTCESIDVDFTTATMGFNFAVGDIDTSGTLYINWVGRDGSAVFYSFSTDRGSTWSAPFEITASLGPGTRTFPWMVAGSKGRIGIIWQESVEVKPGVNGKLPAGNPNLVDKETTLWHIFYAYIENADTTNPKVTIMRVTERPNHRGCIQSGLVQQGQGSCPNRTLLDFNAVAKGPSGEVHVVWSDSLNGGHNIRPLVIYAKQETGPSLFEGVGFLDPHKDAPFTASARMFHGRTLVEGTHNQPPGNWAQDKSSDARDLTPIHLDHLDLLKATILASPTSTTPSLTFTWSFAGKPSLAAQASPDQATMDDGYFFTWYAPSDNKYHWVGITAPRSQLASGTPFTTNARFGTVIMLSPAPGVLVPYLKAFLIEGTAPAIVYPAGRLEATLTISIDKVGGDTSNPTAYIMETASAYTFLVLRQREFRSDAIAGTEIVPIDGAGAFDTRWGEQLRPVGTIESSDSPDFTRVVTATFVDYPSTNNWQAAMSKLFRTVFVRQVIFNTVSPTLQVTTTMPPASSQGHSLVASTSTSAARSGSTVEIAAVAFNDQGGVAGVQLSLSLTSPAGATVWAAQGSTQEDGTLTTTLTVSATWLDGQYTLTATSQSGATASTPLTVDNTPPTITGFTVQPDLTNPATATITFTATLTDLSATTATLLVTAPDGTRFSQPMILTQSTSESSTYTLTWDASIIISLPAGTYHIQVAATDAAGNQAQSGPVALVIPTISLTG